MEFLYTVATLLLTLGILVSIHEYGHFWVARRCGVKVLRFSIGFGPALASWRDKYDTEYTLALIPLGGYVKMLDEREGEVAASELDQAFNRKPVMQRIAVVSAGPLANFLLAIVAFWFLYMAGESGYAPIVGTVETNSVADMAGLEPGQEIIAIDGARTPTRQAVSFRLLDRIGDTGTISFTVKYPDSDMVYESQAAISTWLSEQEQPDLLGGVGLRFYTPDILPEVGKVSPDSPAERAGLQTGDLVLSADGVVMPLWDDWVNYVRARPEQNINLQVQRGSEVFNSTIVPEKISSEEGEPFGRVGVMVHVPPMPDELKRSFVRGPLESLTASLVRTGELTAFTFNSIKKMLQGLISPKHLSGPITIAKVATASAKSGLESYIGFLALLSVSLGVLNLLPIPVLDGGHLLYYTLELLAGRPVPEKVQMVGYQFGLVVVLSIMALALFNDFVRL